MPAPPRCAERGTVTEDSAAPPQRVAPVVLPERWMAPGKPEGATATVQDTYRQTGFQLGGDLRLLTEGMNLQIQVMQDSHPSRYRTLPLAAATMYWSRAFLAIGDAALLASRGSYASCPALVRAACEAIAAEMQSGGDEQPLFTAWLCDALQPNEEQRATEIGLGHYFAGSTLAAAPLLGATYRSAAELSRQHFGATLIEVAPESNREKLAVTFGDQTFHYGWAQLVFGWLLTLCIVQIGHSLTDSSPFFASDETRDVAAAFLARGSTSLQGTERCRIEEMLDEGRRRYLVLNFRRQSTGAPRKLLL
jgi:hypothetical protein